MPYTSIGRFSRTIFPSNIKYDGPVYLDRPNYSKNNESFINILRDEEFIDEKNLKWIELVKNKKDVERKESFRNFIEFTSVIIIIIIYVKFRRKKLKV